MGNKAPAPDSHGESPTSETRSRAASNARSGGSNASTPSRERRNTKTSTLRKPFVKYEEPITTAGPSAAEPVADGTKIDLERLYQDLPKVNTLNEDPLLLQLSLVWQVLLANSLDHAHVSDDQLSECREYLPSKYFYSAAQAFSLASVHALDDFMHTVIQRLRPRDRRPKISSISPLSSALAGLPPSMAQCNFHDFYLFCFQYGLNEHAKVLERDVAIYLWRGILKDKTQHLQNWCEYLENHYAHGITFDTWKCYLEFIETISTDLSNYDPEGAWPTVIDDYYNYRKSS